MNLDYIGYDGYIYTSNGTRIVVPSAKEIVEYLLKFQKNDPEAYFEFDGKRLYARDVEEGKTIEENFDKVVEMTPEDHVRSIWLQEQDGSSSTVRSAEDAISRLIALKESDPDAYIEFAGRRLYARDVEEGKTTEENFKSAKKNDAEVYIKKIDDYIRESEDPEYGTGDFSSFDLARIIKDIPDRLTRQQVLIHYVDRLLGIPAITDQIAIEATPEERVELLEIYKENSIPINPNIFKVDSIELRMAQTAASNWGDPEPQNLTEAQRITDGSEKSSIKGIVETLMLGSYFEEALLSEVYTRTEISEGIAEMITEKLGEGSKYELILEMLAVVHDEWVKNNSNNFLKPDRNKERQFVPLQLLNWGEVESDLLFLRTILSAAGVEIDDEELKRTFEEQQKAYMVENGIFSHEDLVEHLRTGVEFYPALEGLRTVHNDEKTISDLLAEPEIAERMATQIESKVQIRSREELGVSEPLKEEKTEHEVTPKEIAEADKEQALTTAEVGRFKKILNKLKEFFKGKGEK